MDQKDQKLERLLRKLRGELGKIVLDALEDRLVTEIMLNSDGSLWIERHGEGMKCVGSMSAPNAESLMGTIADSLNTVVTRENAILEGELPLDGSRFEGLLPPLVAHPSFNIRKKATEIFSLEQYVERGVMSAAYFNAIKNAIKERKNILVAGGTGSGKTTLTNAIIDSISKLCPEDRLVIMEDTSEIQCGAKNAVILRTSVNTTMRHLLRATMRLRPDRILVGEVRDGAALELLKAWNTGHPGGVATLHCDSADESLLRLEDLVSEETQTPKHRLISAAVDMVVFIKKDTTHPAGRRVSEIIRVNGFNGQTYETIPVSEAKTSKESAHAVA